MKNKVDNSLGIGYYYFGGECMRNISIRRMTEISLFIVLICVGAFIKIPFPLVPISLQTLFVMLGGLLLGSKGGAIAAGCYVFAGLIGLPIFTGGGGPAYVFNPTFGYLIGMILGAYACGAVKEKLMKKCGNMDNGKKFAIYLKSTIVGSLVVYAVGVPYLIFIVNVYLGSTTGIMSLIMSGFVMTLPGGVVKCLVASAVAARIDKAVGV